MSTHWLPCGTAPFSKAYRRFTGFMLIWVIRWPASTSRTSAFTSEKACCTKGRERGAAEGQLCKPNIVRERLAPFCAPAQRTEAATGWTHVEQGHQLLLGCRVGCRLRLGGVNLGAAHRLAGHDKHVALQAAHHHAAGDVLPLVRRLQGGQGDRLAGAG